MKISDNGIKFISKWEGKRNSVCLDVVDDFLITGGTGNSGCVITWYVGV